VERNTSHGLSGKHKYILSAIIHQKNLSKTKKKPQQPWG